ncbi:DNA/RNA polymerase superfamily protein [Gossypium australe]|uniref:DNA/RNA polymerase superfamily protein n=1 Tax=Gossypium australe TaxID=47621 RepID=A0A5B6WZZ4_9ROSI|nr:DNA/RNA polymerase superfamily protein [Gossypium australe]
MKSSIKKAPYKALYGWKCRTPLYWTKLNDSKISSIDVIRETKDKVRIIQGCLKATIDRQKSYVDLKRKDIEFQKKGKLIPRFIGSYEIIKRIDGVAYCLALPEELEKIHNIFHVLMLKQYGSDPSHVISPVEIELQPNMSYSEEPIRILAREVKELRNKGIFLCHGVEETTWELEETMRMQNPNLFSGKIFGDENSFSGESKRTKM